ncbi:MAG: DUF4303 domain-containing protein [Planctomycetaceae bacterium]
MHTFDFERFERDFRDACIAGVRLLVERYNSVPFYALCIYSDSFDGCFALYANTHADFEEQLLYYQEKFPDSYHLDDKIKNLKYNCGDWKYQSVGEPPKDFHECISNVLDTWEREVYELSYRRNALTERDYQAFEEIACRIALSSELRSEVERLNRTDDFAVTVSNHDEPSLASIERPRWYSRFGSLNGFDPMDC